MWVRQVTLRTGGQKPEGLAWGVHAFPWGVEICTCAPRLGPCELALPCQGTGPHSPQPPGPHGVPGTQKAAEANASLQIP